jgi:hypothetical protein
MDNMEYGIIGPLRIKLYFQRPEWSIIFISLIVQIKKDFKVNSNTSGARSSCESTRLLFSMNV